MRSVLAASTLLLLLTGCSLLESDEPTEESQSQPTASASPEQEAPLPVKQQLEDADFVYQTAWEDRSEDGEEFVANREVWENSRTATAVVIDDKMGIFLVAGVTFHGDAIVTCERDDRSSDLEQSILEAQTLRDGMQDGSIDTTPDPERGNQEVAAADGVVCWM